MATNFPTLLDTFTNPLATSLQTSPSHSEQHSNINDAVEALEAKVGIGNTVLGNYTSWTPGGAAWTPGNGTWSAFYARVNNFVHAYATFTFGSTSVVTSSILVSGLPVSIHADMISSGTYGADFVIGEATYQTSGAGGAAPYLGIVASNSATQVRLWVSNASGTYLRTSATTSTVPFTWAAGDTFRFSCFYKAA
jgi:hypothetical protein